MQSFLLDVRIVTMNLSVTVGVACAVMLASTASSEQTLPTKPGINNDVITISCFRGPSSIVIWDRPNSVFVEDLERYGYSYLQARAIGEHICRDEYGVEQPGYMRTALLKIIAQTPPQ